MKGNFGAPGTIGPAGLEGPEGPKVYPYNKNNNLYP